uniref:ABC-type sugar transport system, periplasmic binding protein YcjN n=1 Tax=uncultured Thiotrichaceae bacterium TaxID=298394 RepID=A0A6S6UAP4_9GAMM|nr:MAG: ABC-type sugar transport system, periplasmic binding protein YcjN [uncultured Thiotrichaceae bacterium]
MKYPSKGLTGRLVLSAAISFAVLAGGTASAEDIRFWTTEEQPERMAKQQEMADEFKKATGHNVEVIPVTEKDMGTRATAAFAANDLPDVIYHPLQYALPWAEAGILDTESATEVVDELGKDTFAPGSVSMAAYDGGIASVPVDGWTQMIVYRADLFKEKGLEPPTNYANVEAAIKALHNPPEMYGFVTATKVDEGYMSQVLEHVFLANGVSPVGKDGFKALEEGPTTEVLNFYKALAEASPPGELFWKQSREVYLDGKAAMVIWSPSILDELGGLRDSAPVTIGDDPTTKDLAKKTGIITTFSGPSNKDGAAWGDVRYFGITSDAETDVAKEFVKFSMDQGYMQTLSISPEGKFPVRSGTKDEMDKFTKGWSMLDVGVDRKAPLSDIYAPEVIDDIVSGLKTAQRWGVEEGQLSLASKMINAQPINRIVRKFIDGEVDAAGAVKELNEELAKVK